jgi:hypothetical protein
MSQSDSCPDKGLLVTYLYGEGEPSEREEFEAHLDACPGCREELGALERVRVDLGWWEAPEAVGHVSIVQPGVPHTGTWAWVRTPAFGLAAAALLLLALTASIARVEVRADAGGVTLRTGWGSGSGAEATPTAAPVEPAGVDAAAPGGERPWRDDIEAIAMQLRGEMEQARTPLAAAGPGQPTTVSVTPEVRRLVLQLVEDSERRQRQDLALRLTELSRDLEIQRRSDLVRIQQIFGRLEGRTEAEAARAREMMNYFVRVSQQTPQR